MPDGDFPLPPAKITSSVFLDRSALWLVSPSTQRTASETFDLPEPLGPTMAVMPGSKRNVARVAKLLNPRTSSRVSLGASCSVCSTMPSTRNPHIHTYGWIPKGIHPMARDAHHDHGRISSGIRAPTDQPH